jgi:uncharacterized protein YdeI (YjbR/CyaY-like superfamily)
MAREPKPASGPMFFESPAHWRAWLRKNHKAETSLLVGMRKVGSGTSTMTWSESVDEALCFSWIDGVRRSLGHEGYTIRFSARKKGSIWSRVNIAKVEALVGLERMRPAGLAAFQARSEQRSGIYSFEQKSAELDSGSRARFMKNRKAWAFFEKQAPSYRKRVAWWLSSARKPGTREVRLEKVIGLSALSKTL